MSDQIPDGMKRCIKCGEIKPHEMFARDKTTKDGLKFRCKDCLNSVRRKPNNTRPIPRPDGMKQCARCQEIKPPEMFHRQKGSSDGLRYWCKACQKKMDAERYAQDRAARRAHSRAYYREHREQEISRATRWNQANQDRHRANARRWNKDNRLRHSRNRRAYTARHIERIRATDRARNKVLARHLQRLISNHRRRARLLALPGVFTVRDIEHIAAMQQGHCAYCGRLGQTLTIEHIIPVTREGSSNDPWNIALACSLCNTSKGDKLLEEWLATGPWYTFQPYSE